MTVVARHAVVVAGGGFVDIAAGAGVGSVPGAAVLVDFD